MIGSAQAPCTWLRRVHPCAHLGQHLLAGHAVDDGRVHVEDGVVEVGVRVGARPGAQQVLPLLAAQEGHVLHKVGHALRAYTHMPHADRMDPQGSPCI